MIQARLAVSDISHEAAKLNIDLSIQSNANGIEWSYDPKLYWSSPVYFCEDQVLDLFRHIEAPILAMSATPLSRYMREPKYQQRLEALADGRHELIEGGHHFHMEKPDHVAALIHSFVLEQEHCPSST
jgi:pimeloyl-ACP methyl ester carboxylesterase